MHRWKYSALAAAAFVSAAMTTTDAEALALGSLTVQSALGENLRAEIAIPQITSAEMDSLLSSIASPEVFRAQGMSYSPAARSIRVQLQRNADGTASLRLSSTTPINEPFLDLVLESNWSSGHLVRSYTLLLDPPASQRRTTAPVTAPQVAVQPAPASVTGRSYSSNATPAVRASAPASEPLAAAAPSTPSAPTEEVRVRAGDTAGKIAQQYRPASASLDQMLVAMLRNNPNAFINGNVNRLRAGAVVQIPSREQALETSEGEARRIVAAQSRDFNAYRRGLASKAPSAEVQSADRSSGGQVQARVEDASPASTQADKLTLSKGDIQATASAEEQLAQQKQSQDQSARLSELQRNLAELNELAQQPSTNTGAPTATPAQAPVENTASAAPDASSTEQNSNSSTPAIDIATSASLPAASASEAGTSAAVSTAAPNATTNAVTPTAAEAATETPPSAPTPKPKPKAPPPPPPEPTLMETLLENPLVPAGTGIVALLLGLLGYRTWKRRRDAAAEQNPAFHDSQVPPDSFFGGSGGQQVDTNSAEGATTMAYSPSQLDANGDIDPVAEADVYLALGRDVQAEEILKEALHSQPERASIHMKLAEIYAKRQDANGLENTARKVQELSGPESSDWKRVVIMGRNIDPTNPLYASAGDAGMDTTFPQSTSSFADALQNVTPAPQVIPEVDINLDLDLPEGLSTPAAPPVVAPVAPSPSDDDFAALDLDTQIDLNKPHTLMDPPTLVADTVMPDLAVPTAPLAMPDANTLDLDLSAFEMPAPASKEAKAASAAETTQDLGMDLGSGLDFNLDSDALTEPATPSVQPMAAPAADNALDFDLGSLDLNLDIDSAAMPAPSAEAVHNAVDDPLSTKLDLAQEFNTIGDSEGARALIEEVLAEANGPMKARAQKMLSELD